MLLRQASGLAQPRRRPPCGEYSVPPYPALDQSPAVKFWSEAEFAPDSSSVPAARILLVIVVVIPIVAAVAIPTMVVGHLAVTAIPVAFIEALPIMTRFHPAGSCVCRPSPVSVVPRSEEHTSELH